MAAGGASNPLPYKLAVLCYLYDGDGHVLMLHRLHDPNRGMYSPVGGKLDTTSGEGPHQCAQREIREETGVNLSPDEVRLTGVVTERAYQGEAHWLIFLFETIRPVARHEVLWSQFREGTLEWKRIEDVSRLDIPRTDREVMWPLVQAHRGGFFAVHIDWSGDDIRWRVNESCRAEDAAGGPGARGHAGGSRGSPAGPRSGP